MPKMSGGLECAGRPGGLSMGKRLVPGPAVKLMGFPALAEVLQTRGTRGPPGVYRYLYAISVLICGFWVIDMDM